VPLAADLEIHGTEFGYVGFCRLPADRVNICGLFHLPPASCDVRHPPVDLLRGSPGTPLWDRLQRGVIERDSFCAVAGLSLQPHRATARPECCIGDALTMTPPVTGNGMSMAFEAAELAIEPLATYARGESSWAQARQNVAAACDLAFASRLAWARWLQWMMLTPLLRSWLGTRALRSGLLWRVMFARTR
jgi:2-polyprenyl-6-methoxyphenol hydroxylase-like FAD-dependent oxidoreductase